jgi:hypothetical protein
MNYEVLIVDDHSLYRLALKGAVAAACMDSELFEADSVASRRHRLSVPVIAACRR